MSKNVVSYLLYLIAVFSGIFAVYFYIEYTDEVTKINVSAETSLLVQKEFNSNYDTEQSSIPSSSDTELKDKERKNLDWEKIDSSYPNILAWIEIPGTKINYPIMQSNDNQYYLNHSYQGNEDFLGSIFFDYRQNTDFSELNTFIYGHNANKDWDSPMFGELVNYYDSSWFNNHKKIILYTREKVYYGEVFGVHADSYDTESRKLSFDNISELREYAQFMKDSSEVKSDIDVDNIDNVVTLWTCAMRTIVNTNGQNVAHDKARTFISISIY